MPSTIPYDPSLVLANVVSMDAINIVKQISAAQAPADAAQEDLNSLMQSKRSLDMTKTELVNLEIDTKELDEAMKGMKESIGKAAAAYATAKVKAEATIQPLRSKIQMVHAEVESPVDFIKTEIKSLPLAADSLNMDVQYFSLDANRQTADSFASAISSFVSASTSFLGPTVSTQMSTSAQKQASDQVSTHSILGTLVFSIACTHKNASILAPFYINVDKGIKAWNHLFPSDAINGISEQAMTSIVQQAAGQQNPDEKKFSIISGMTFGSSFVGMVHILNTTNSTVSDDLSVSQYAASLQSKMNAGAWFASASGGFGVDSTIGNEVKNLLSTQNISSHVTLISMGVIPSVVASDVQIAAQQFAKFDPESNMQAIATLSAAASTNQTTVKEAADNARTGAQMTSLQAANIQASLSALATIDDGKNKILDINSLMTALDDYLKKAQAGTAGVPINYYLKDITKDMLAEMWLTKYIPGKFLSIGNDDSALPPPPGASNAPAAATPAAAAPADSSAAPAASS